MSHKILPLFSVVIGFTILAGITMIPISANSPWQLFQHMCPYLSAQSPQCAMVNNQQLPQPQQPYPQQQQPYPQQQQPYPQQQQPYPQQQQPILPQPQQPIPQQQQLCPDGSQPDANGICPIPQQQTLPPINQTR
jgi:DNA segregation ATPase FtsK/SpoIIIE, S-DNA-T family